MKASEVLRGAIKLIKKDSKGRSGWAVGVYMTAPKDQTFRREDCYCIVGAMHEAAGGQTNEGYVEALRAMKEEVNPGSTSTEGGVTLWNDRASGPEEVMRTVAKVARKLEKQGL